MAETRRALKPGGTLHFAEHVRPRGAFGRVLDMVAPAWERIAAGCHPNRRTVEDIRGAGFDTRELRRGRLSGVLPLVSGVAVAPTYGREAGEPQTDLRNCSRDIIARPGDAVDESFIAAWRIAPLLADLQAARNPARAPRAAAQIDGLMELL